jgi:hypothetical protein
MIKVIGAIFVLMTFCVCGMIEAANLDDFDGNSLNKMWTCRDQAKKGTYKLEKGLLLLDLKASADMFRRGTDGGVCLLMDPPNLDNFSVEMMVNVCVKGTQPPACQVGLIFFNEAEWSYTVWGPYNAGQDIRMEDCIEQDYRWRDQTLLGVDIAKVAIDKDVYIMITKTGTKLEFFAKGSKDETWISGGVDQKLGPKYVQGKYKVGICAKSWGGSVDSSFEIDYFNIPEVAKAVDSHGKLATTWSTIKN